MADLVRVRVNGYEKSLGRAYAVAHDLEILDEPATDRLGKTLPTTRRGGRKPKPKTTVNKAAEEKQKAAVTESAPTEEEQSR